MNLEEIQTTPVWKLYEKHKEYLDKLSYFSKSDTNERFYVGDQWHYLKKSKSINPIVINFIKQIVNQKVSSITENLFAVNYSPENIEAIEFMEKAKKICEQLNKKASNIYDFDKFDNKIKRWAFESAIFGEAVAYVNYDKDTGKITNEDIHNTNIFYGDENNRNIQEQPYILIRQRKTVSAVQLLAKQNNVAENLINSIRGDSDNEEEPGNVEEVDNKLWLITKYWKDEEGKVHYSQSTKTVIIVDDEEQGTNKYPFAHTLWTEKRDYARGISEVEYLIPNQIEVNLTETRRAMTVKNTAYTKTVVNEDAISNKNDINKVGATIYFKDMGSLRASDIFMNTTPAQMSSDAERLLNELITLSKDTSNVSEATTGNIDPSSASGRAILAVQQAQSQPLNEQLLSLKGFLEDLARIWFEFWKNDDKKLKIFYTELDPITNKELFIEEDLDSETLNQLEAFVKVDITPRGAFDKYARELTLENDMQAGFITFEEYVRALPTDSVQDKMTLTSILNERAKKQAQINQIDLQAEQMKDMANAQMLDAQNIENISDEGSSLMAQALDKAKETGYGTDPNMSDVSNKFSGQ